MSDGNGFASGLAGLSGVAGAILGVGAAGEDPQISAGAGLMIGGVVGTAAGWIVGHVVTIALQIALALLALAIIGYRILSFLNVLSG